MYKLKKWHFELWGKNKAIAWGFVCGNPRFLQGTFIGTSTIREISFDEDEEQIVLKTKSGSHYVLSYSELNMDELENTRACSDALNIPSSTLDKLVEYNTKNGDGVHNEFAEKNQPMSALITPEQDEE